MIVFIIVIAWLVLGYIGARLSVVEDRGWGREPARGFAVVMWASGPLGLAFGLMLAAPAVELHAPAFLSAFLKKVLP